MIRYRHSCEEVKLDAIQRQIGSQTDYSERNLATPEQYLLKEPLLVYCKTFKSLLVRD